MAMPLVNVKIIEGVFDASRSSGLFGTSLKH